jgi:hypothetical protein
LAKHGRIEEAITQLRHLADADDRDYDSFR